MVLGYAFFGYSAPVEARLLAPSQRQQVRWKTIEPNDFLDGATIPANMNVIIKLPVEIDRITLDTLFGGSSNTVRFWGYCFPQQQQERQSHGFPGKIFLSHKERSERRERLGRQRAQNLDVMNPRNLTEEDLNGDPRDPRGLIRHQKSIFHGGETCFIMTSHPLAAGPDLDGDHANRAVENKHKTDPTVPDTDGDGILDGTEIDGDTSPTLRDSDGDGLLDGIEDKNLNGRVDYQETNPAEWDTDRDGLCDGACIVNRGTELRGEDKNLNGEVDNGETDPRNPDTDGDGINDEQEVYNCLLAGGTNC